MFAVDSHKCSLISIADPVLPDEAGEVLHWPEVLLPEDPGGLHQVSIVCIVSRGYTYYTPLHHVRLQT